MPFRRVLYHYMNRYDDRSRLVFMFAREEGAKLGAPHIGPELILLGLLREGGDTAHVLEQHGVLEHAVRSRLENEYRDSASTPPFLSITPSARSLMQQAGIHAESDNGSLIKTKHILLALLHEPGSLALTIMQDLGANIERLQHAFDAEPVAAAAPAPAPTLEQFSRDLTALARAGELDPVIGRDAEIERIIHILVRRTKNNPVLLGEPGVGKTAVVEGLAQTLASDDVPPALAGARILTLDLAQLVAGTKFRGEFEERLHRILEELRGTNVIAFIDELHTVVGAGSAEGSLDAANILKPALSRGEVQLIGATTHAEYEQYIEKDAALERRFQPVLIQEPSPEETLAVLTGLKERYETHHDITIPSAILAYCVQLAAKSLPTRRFPDKAIDLLDEAAARASIRGGEPRELTAVDVETVLHSWSGQYSEGEQRERMRHLTEHLFSRVFGQDDAIATVSQALQRRQIGLSPRNRVAGALHLAGPAGTGKRHFSAELTRYLRGGDDYLIVFNGPDYSGRDALHRLLGPAPGFRGADRGGVLTNALKRKPFSVLLFANALALHPDVLNLLTELLRTGQLGDTHPIDAGSVLVILTEDVGERSGVSFQQSGDAGEVRSQLPPTLLELCDASAPFRAFGRETVQQFIHHELETLQVTLTQSGWNVTFAPSVVSGIEQLLGDAVNARAILRTVQDSLIDPLSEALLLHEPSEVLAVTFVGGTLRLQPSEVHA